ncbi:MAG: M1 family metallopeptidase, partial [Thermodesulfobacteriota bacterium]
MKRLIFAISVVLTLASTSTSVNAQEPVRHDLRVTLYPEEQRLTVKDTLTVPEDLLPDLPFLLHRGLEPSSPTPGVRIVRVTGKPETIPLESFRVTLPPGKKTFVLEYGGNIYHPLAPYGKEHARGFKQTAGMISREGVYLARSSFWYPIFGEGLLIFTLQVEVPPGWNAISQGDRTLYARGVDTTSLRWESPEPQEEIFIVAGKFTQYRQPAGRAEAMVFLRTPDRDLAKRYLDATARYIALYEKLIGPYPYGKFALVENFWETGFGMPSFTLLGPKVIRFPFILHSSYPHEILHNWWGNSVFPDYTKGNWAEGLTAYLSDHLIKGERGSAVEYRQATLQKYADYVLSGRDFPLAQFRSRHSSPSETVGYGKSLMFFHMLRMRLGDEAFVKGLRDFYQENRFRFASFDDLRSSFEGTSGKDLRSEFNQWVTQPGAPKIKVSRAKVEPEGDG